MTMRLDRSGGRCSRQDLIRGIAFEQDWLGEDVGLGGRFDEVAQVTKEDLSGLLVEGGRGRQVGKVTGQRHQERLDVERLDLRPVQLPYHDGVVECSLRECREVRRAEDSLVSR
jgi:hypothetical protein